MNNLIGIVKNVLDNFVVEFEIPGLIDNGKAIPLYTMHEPEVGMEILIIKGNDILNNLYFYSIIKITEEVMYKALSSYLKFDKSGNIELKSSKKLFIGNSEDNLYDLLMQIYDYLNSIPAYYIAGANPITPNGAGNTPLAMIKQNLEKLLTNTSTE